MELKTNTCLYNNRYNIKSCIGNGGFGITYLAWDNQLRREVVLKEYFPQYMVRRDTTINNEVITISQSYADDFQTGINKFLYEAQVLATLRNIPEIAEVYDYFKDNNTAYIVMEYIKGNNLKRYIRERQTPFSFAEAMSFILPCLKALSRVHEAGIIHRDFTPDNIIIDENRKIRIIDFGSSRDYVNNQATMTVMVKHGYAPVEQYSNTVRQAAYTDVYSLCAILYEMVTLKKPMSALDRVAADVLPAPMEYNSTITKAQNAAIMKGLSISCQQRYQSCAETEQALMQALYAVGESEATQMVRVTSNVASVNDKNVTEIVRTGDYSNQNNYNNVQNSQNNNGKDYYGTNDMSTGFKQTRKSPIFMISVSVLATLVVILGIVFTLNMTKKKSYEAEETDVDFIQTVADNSEKDRDNVMDSAAEAPAETADEAPVPNGEVQEISFMVWDDLDATGDLISKGYADSIDRFNKDYEGIYHCTPIETSLEEYYVKLNALIAAGETPDVFIVSNGANKNDYALTGVAAPLDQYLKADGWKDTFISDAVFTGETYSEKICAIPLNFSAACVFYNKEMFADAGVEVPKTFDELLEACQKLQNAGYTPITISAETAWCLSMLAGYLCDRNGVNLNNIKAHDTDWKDERVINAGKQIQQLSKYFQRTAAGDDNDVATEAFYNEEAAILIQGSWSIGLINALGANGFEDKVGVFAFPAVAGGNEDSTRVIAKADSLMMSANSKCPDGAVALMKYFVDDTAQKYTAEVGGKIPVTKVDYDTSVAPPELKYVMDIFRNASSTIGFYDESLADYQAGSIFDDCFVEIFKGEDPETALDPLQEYYEYYVW